MVVSLRLKRMGRINRPFYRAYATDSRSPRDGRTIEQVGFYDPLAPRQEDQLKLDGDRIKYWVSVGAQPSEVLWSLIKRAGIEIARKPKAKRERKHGARTWTPPKKRAPRIRKKKAAPVEAGAEQKS